MLTNNRGKISIKYCVLSIVGLAVLSYYILHTTYYKSPVLAQAPTCSTGTNSIRLNAGLLSVANPNLEGNFSFLSGSTPLCIIDKTATIPQFSLLNYDDLKSFYFTQSKFTNKVSYPTSQTQSGPTTPIDLSAPVAFTVPSGNWLAERWHNIVNIFKNILPKKALAAPARAPKTVFAFYYPWYSAPPNHANYGHWDANGHTPPSDIASASYPTIDPYDSYNPSVLDLHMTWLNMAKVDVIVLSWWGQGSYEDQAVQAIMDKAAGSDIKVAFHIEPYFGRTPASTVADIKYIYQKYGSSPAFYWVSRPTIYSSNSNPRGVFFIYDVMASDPWIPALDSIRNTADDAIILARMDDAIMMTDAGARQQVGYIHADGIYNYGAYDGSTYSGTLPQPTDYIWAPAAAPGFDDTRVRSPNWQAARNNGARYDSSWQPLATQKPEWITIVSFNEWNETTQIEPAKPYTSSGGFTYLDYEGHYGLTGANAYSAYLNRTAYWVDQYKTVVTPTPTLTPTPTPSQLGKIYHITGNLTINSNITVNKPGVIFVDGDLLINTNLTHTSSGAGLVFVVGGNIYTNKSVNEIDAFMVTGGQFCSAADTSTIPPSCLPTGTTAQQLIINGSVISLDASKTPQFARSLSNNTEPAELINYDPKYLVITKDVFARELSIWSEIE